MVRGVKRMYIKNVKIKNGTKLYKEDLFELERILRNSAETNF